MCTFNYLQNHYQFRAAVVSVTWCQYQPAMCPTGSLPSAASPHLAQNRRSKESFRSSRARLFLFSFCSIWLAQVTEEHLPPSTTVIWSYRSLSKYQSFVTDGSEDFCTLRRAVSYKLNDVSEVLTVPIIWEITRFRLRNSRLTFHTRILRYLARLSGVEMHLSVG
jgi:hypothetical protein